MSFIHNNSYNSLEKSGCSNAARLFSVAINSLGTDADEVITEALP